MIQIDENYDGRNVSAKILDKLELSLPENPTTGYRWEFESNGEPVCKLDSTEYQATAGGVGSGGVRRWKFSVVAAGTSSIRLKYRRSFETGKPPAKTFALNVSATE
jgi:inhibitor of cysteine peptidase